jgi:predicted dinucleotide-binding enzyme
VAIEAAGYKIGSFPEGKMKVGILGSGEVGQSLADGFIKYGHEVMIGTRDAAKLDDWKKQAGAKGNVGGFADAAAFGALLVLATKGSAAKKVLEGVDAKNLDGKTVIDATNPIKDEAPEKGVLKFFTSLEMSFLEQLQAAFPKARFVKAFNTIGADFMVNPDFGGVKPTMFICGNDAKAKAEVSEILKKFGFEPEDMGEALAARAIEPLCILWCIPGFLRNDWSHAFKLLKK